MLPRVHDRARQGAGRVRPAGAGARRRGGRRRRHGRRRQPCAAGAGARGLARRGFFPQRRDRGARRLQGAVRPRRRSSPSPSSTARCRTMRRWRSARSATSARSTRSPALQRTAPRPSQPSIAAAICLLDVNCESHRQLSGRDAEVLRQEPRLPGAAARRRRRPRRAGDRRPRGRGQSARRSRRAVARIRPARRCRLRSPPSRCATRRSP